jgi:hypothetical protein
MTNMGLLAEIFLGLSRKNSNGITDKRSNYIFYKIVDSTSDEEYALQCINTSAIFQAKIIDIVFDIDILHRLHPIQACYIGIEYAKYLKKIDHPSALQNTQNQKLNKYSVYRYGSYSLCYQDRKGNLCFISQKTNEEFIMDPRDIALSEELIQEFDAAQAFYIGLLPGIKMLNLAKDHSKSVEFKRLHLSVVK